MNFATLITTLLFSASCLNAQCLLGYSSKESKDIIKADAYAQFQEYETTSDAYLDQLFIDQIRLGLVIFSLDEGVDMYFYNNPNNMNAWSIDRTGSLDILSFELNLIHQKRKEFPERPDQPCIAIIAHELGHTLQFMRGGVSRLKPFQTELMADFLAGYFMGYKHQIQQASDSDAEVFFTLFFQLGDNSFFSESHHGTPAQRKRAALAGFRYGKQMSPIETVYPLGVQYASTFLLNDGT